MTKDMTTGSPLKNIIRFCLPLMVGNLFQQFYNMADTIIVGQFVGKNALSAVGSVGPLNFMIIGTVIGLCTGFAIPIAQRFGAQDIQNLKKYVANIIYTSIVVGVIFTCVAVLFARPLLEVLNIPIELRDEAYSYIVVIFAGIGATMLYNLLASIVRALGDSKTPLYFLLFSSFLNIGLDLLLIIVFQMGVRGAAVATVVSQFISGVLCFIYVKRSFPILHLTKETKALDFTFIKNLLKNGLPMALQFSITAIGSVMLQSCVNGLGADCIAAVTIGGKTQLMIVLPAETIGITMATYCGQNLGAKKFDRIEKGVHRGVALAFGYAAIGFCVARFLGPYLSLLFIDGSETEIIALAQQYINAGSYFYLILSLLFVLRNALQGLGYSLTAMTAGVFELIARGIMGFGFVNTIGYAAACVANPVAWIAADIFLIPAYIIVSRKVKRSLSSRISEELGVRSEE
ncbi:MAG: MATE family efflux transporter [Clostridia bacterium]|nr:MATE family efflux transporter [Clostridia bacterium]